MSVYFVKHKVKPPMKNYAVKTVNAFNGKIVRTAAVSVASYLRDARYSLDLDDKRVDIFHSSTVPLLIIS